MWYSLAFILEKRIRGVQWLHSKKKIPDNDYNNNIRELKDELDSLLREEAKMELQRYPFTQVASQLLSMFVLHPGVMHTNDEPRRRFKKTDKELPFFDNVYVENKYHNIKSSSSSFKRSYAIGFKL